MHCGGSWPTAMVRDFLSCGQTPACPFMPLPLKIRLKIKYWQVLVLGGYHRDPFEPGINYMMDQKIIISDLQH
jgi:hypothetical protein